MSNITLLVKVDDYRVKFNIEAEMTFVDVMDTDQEVLESLVIDHQNKQVRGNTATYYPYNTLVRIQTITELAKALVAVWLLSTAPTPPLEPMTSF